MAGELKNITPLPSEHRESTILPLTNERGILTMKGGVFPNKSGVGAPYIVRFKKVFKRFWSEIEAERFLTHLRYQDDHDSFDQRDWQKGEPLGFSTLTDHWLTIKKGQVKCLRNLRYHMVYCQLYYGQRNIKDIKYADLEDFLLSLPKGLSGKSKKNVFTTLHSFFAWCVKRDYVDRIPGWPEIKYELGWRATVDKQTQERIIEEVKRISYHINPKIYIGIRWLATYISIRPIELINIKEGDFDLGLGVVNVRYNKESKPKIVPLLDEDIKLVQNFPKSLPYVYFFRHGRRKGVHKSKRSRFGKDYLYKFWKIACNNLGISGIDLYGGTRHSSTRALRERFTPEQIKKDTMHHTNKAFERYYQIELEDSRQVYQGTRGKAEVVHLKKHEGKI